MIGTSDQSCWLAEACKILLLLLGTANILGSNYPLKTIPSENERQSGKHGMVTFPAHVCQVVRNALNLVFHLVCFASAAYTYVTVKDLSQ